MYVGKSVDFGVSRTLLKIDIYVVAIGTDGYL